MMQGLDSTEDQGGMMKGRTALRAIPYVLAWFAAAAVPAANLACAAGAKGEAKPHMVCDEPTWNFGSVDNRTNVEHVFVLKNSGSAHLEIDRVHVCCGVTSLMDEKTVAPGGRTSLRIKVALSGRTGEQSKTVYVMCNDPEQNVYPLRIVGVATAEIEAKPNHASFGTVSRDTPQEKSVTIAARSNVVFHVTDVKVDTNCYSAACRAIVEGTSYEVTVRTVPPFPPGMTKGMVTISTDHPGYPRIVVPALAMVGEDLIVMPSTLLVEKDRAGSAPATRFVGLQSKSKRPFSVVKVQPPSDDIEVKVEPHGDAGYRIRLTGIVTSRVRDKKLVIQTDVPGQEEIAIPFRVQEKAPLR